MEISRKEWVRLVRAVARTISNKSDYIPLFVVKQCADPDKGLMYFEEKIRKHFPNISSSKYLKIFNDVVEEYPNNHITRWLNKMLPYTVPSSYKDLIWYNKHKFPTKK